MGVHASRVLDGLTSARCRRHGWRFRSSPAWKQTQARRAAIAGAAVTLAALLGYFAMTLSPLEGVGAESLIHLLSFVRSPAHVIAPGARHRAAVGLARRAMAYARSWSSAALLAGGFCVEPVTRLAIADRFRYDAVGVAEVGVGVAVLALSTLALRRRGGHDAAPRGR